LPDIALEELACAYGVLRTALQQETEQAEMAQKRDSNTEYSVLNRSGADHSYFSGINIRMQGLVR